MTKRRDDEICPGSQERLGTDETLYCVCGRVWTCRDVPLHDVSGHVQEPERVARRIDRAWETVKERAKVRRGMPLFAVKPMRAVPGGWRMG